MNQIMDVVTQVRKVVVGKDAVIGKILMAMLAGARWRHLGFVGAAAFVWSFVREKHNRKPS